MTIFSINEAQIWTAIQQFVAELTTHPEVLAVVLFGSLARGQFGVGSDVDILIILSHHARPFLDRIALYGPDRFPVDIDVFPYTVAEIENGQPLAQEALQQGRILWQRPGCTLPSAASA